MLSTVKEYISRLSMSSMLRLKSLFREAAYIFVYRNNADSENHAKLHIYTIVVDCKGECLEH